MKVGSVHNLSTDEWLYTLAELLARWKGASLKDIEEQYSYGRLHSYSIIRKRNVFLHVKPIYDLRRMFITFYEDEEATLSQNEQVVFLDEEILEIEKHHPEYLVERQVTVKHDNDHDVDDDIPPAKKKKLIAPDKAMEMAERLYQKLKDKNINEIERIMFQDEGVDPSTIGKILYNHMNENGWKQVDIARPLHMLMKGRTIKDPSLHNWLKRLIKRA